MSKCKAVLDSKKIERLVVVAKDPKKDARKVRGKSPEAK